MKKSTSRSQRVERTDLYQQVTDRIVAALEKGVPPWRKPWRSVEKYASSPFPVNAATGGHYNGVNIMLLWLAAEEKGYRSNRWLTYKQAQAVGGQVRKGESSSLGVIFKPFEKQAEDKSGSKLFDADGKPVMESRVMAKSLYLFNVEQCDSLPESVVGVTAVPLSQEDVDTVSTPVFNRILDMLNASGVKATSFSQNRAFYRPSTDEIVLPAVGQFFSDADYWAALLHELVHASGHAKRLNREGITSSLSRFGDPIYAFEELIAELGSAFLCAELGVYGEVQHESYFASWLKTLKEDKHAIFRASRQAREACEFLLNLAQDVRRSVA
ncbi:TPA: DUF1738 domain-containing protein [Klebsiella pneumoniae]|nr:DUF1738 domain-containing protein [Klebsiella pneumoniae]